MARRGLLQPVKYQAERREWAKARKAAFVDPPTRRNRVWQADFSEFETGGEGIWRLGGITDYSAKMVLACPVTATQTGADLCAVFDAAETRATELLGHDLIYDCVDPVTGEIILIVIVTDNGPAMKSLPVARWFEARTHFTHVRTRNRSPHTNGVIERWFQSLKYDTGLGPLYRHDIDTVFDLVDHVEDFIIEYNTTRPHETLDWDRLSTVTYKPLTPKTQKSEQEP